MVFSVFLMLLLAGSLLFQIENASPETPGPKEEGDPVPLDPEWTDGPGWKGGPMGVSYVGNPIVVIEVSYRPNHLAAREEGRITLELFQNFVPITTGHIVGLAQSGFYDDTIYHRIIDDFVIQGGDPDANDPLVDGSGTTIPLEINRNLSHKDGAIGMAREFGDPDSADSQWYITDGPQHGLDDWNRSSSLYSNIDENGYAVFGVVRDGMQHVRKLACVPTSRHPAGCENPGSPTAVDDRPWVDTDVVKFHVTDHVRPLPAKKDGGLSTEAKVAGGLVGLVLVGLAIFVAVPALSTHLGRAPPSAQPGAPLEAEELAEAEPTTDTNLEENWKGS